MPNVTPLGFGGTGTGVGFGVGREVGSAVGEGVACGGAAWGDGVAPGGREVVSGASEPAPGEAHPPRMTTVATATAPSARLPSTGTRSWDACLHGAPPPTGRVVDD
jgi:hypothetical protein